MSQPSKVFCALHADYVLASPYNCQGNCSCLSCTGLNCNICGVLQQRKLTDATRRAEMIRCAKCRGLIENQK